MVVVEAEDDSITVPGVVGEDSVDVRLTKLNIGCDVKTIDVVVDVSITIGEELETVLRVLLKVDVELTEFDVDCVGKT
jgi:hypothetical protein